MVEMKQQVTKFFAVLSAVCLTAGSLTLSDRYIPAPTVEAKTIAEIEAEKKEKQDEIQAKKNELESLAKDISQKEKYQETLQEEIDLINGKMLLIDTQLQNVMNEIADKQAGIDTLQIQIEQQQAAVEEGLETFKTRIRTLYVHGNDSLLSALIGATDFYDVLAKIDLINRIAKHDDEMCKDLQTQLEELDASQQDLTAQLQALNLKQTEMESLKKEFSESREELDAAMAETDLAKEELEHAQAHASNELNSFEQELADLQSEEEWLILEDAKRRAEEEAKKKKEAEEEAARIQSSIEAAKTTTAATSTGSGNVTTATTAKTTAVTTPAPTATTPVYVGGTLAWPAPGFYHISSGFGWRWGRQHNGIDIAGAGIHYANACAAAAGTVTVVKTGCTHDYGTACSCNGGYGNYVRISHGNGLETLYAHLASVNVSVGQSVSTGTVVGKIGATGNVVSSGGGGYHLHFSVIVNGTFVDPTNYLY